jgi:hypothetical protein
MASKSFINPELDWAESQLLSWKGYVDNNPLDQLSDRIEWKETNRGRSPHVIASIETQGKFIQETMKNYLMLLEVVDKLREKEKEKEKEKKARGSSEIPERMR